MKKGNSYNYKLPKIKDVAKMYLKNRLSCEKIAKIFGVTNGAVRNALRRHDIKLRSMSDSQEINSNRISITNEILDFLNGMLLGDGSLVLAAKNKKSCRYSHTDKNRQYIYWLKRKLTEFGFEIKRIGTETRKCGRVYYHLTSICYRDLLPLRTMWYPNGKKKTPHNLKVCPTVLLNWYIGDGNLGVRKNSEPVTIAMLYDLDGREMLSRILRDIGINNSVHTTCIYIKKDSRDLFFKYLLKSNVDIPRCYWYKFPKRYMEVLKCRSKE